MKKKDFLLFPLLLQKNNSFLALYKLKKKALRMMLGISRIIWNNVKSYHSFGKNRKNLFLDKSSSALIILDLQEKILNPIPDNDLIIKNIYKIVDTFKVFNKKIYSTEQYPEKLGSTITLNACIEVYKKRSFSCKQCKDLIDELKAMKVKSIIICGIESHICILQSCIDLVNLGFEVHLLSDAIGSRNINDHHIALRRLELSGVIISSTETAIFELCKTSENIDFKQISEIIKRK